MSNVKRNSYLAKNTIIFAVGNFATKLLTFFLVPLYTYALSTSEYGTADLLYTISNFLFPLFTLNVSEAIFRFSMDKNDKNNKDKIFSIAIFCFCLSTFLSILTIPFLNLFQNYKDYSIIFYFYLISMSLCQILLVYLKGNENLKFFTLGNIFNSFFILVFNLIFLFNMENKVKAFFITYIISNILTVFLVFILGKNEFKFNKLSFDVRLFKSMCKYSLVLIPTSFMWWIINSSDRIMITNFISPSASGIYAISYKIPTIITVFASIFNQAWIFSAVNEKDSDDYESYTNTVFYKLFCFLCIIAILLISFTKIITKLFVSPDFYSSWKYMPLLIVGFVFMTLSTFVSSSYNVHKDSKGLLFSGMIGAISNLILNSLLIPFFSIYGAAIATVFSYILVFVYRIYDTKKYVCIHINKDFLIAIIFLVIACFTLYFDCIFISIFRYLLVLIFCLWKKDFISDTIKYFIDHLKRKISK